MQPELSDYDAWFNVKDHLLVLGVSALEDGKLADFHARFLAHMKKRCGLELGRMRRAEKWLMPRIRSGCPIDYGTGRILFAGEAAGFLNPMGEGISAGMESGHAAAMAVLNHLNDPSAALADYQAGTAELHAYMRRQWSLIAGLSEGFHEMMAF